MDLDLDFQSSGFACLSLNQKTTNTYGIEADPDYVWKAEDLRELAVYLEEIADDIDDINTGNLPNKLVIHGTTYIAQEK